MLAISFLSLLLALAPQVLSSPSHSTRSLSPRNGQLPPSVFADGPFAPKNWPMPNTVTGDTHGWGGIHVHDPSIIFADGWYYSFTTHDKMAMGRSRDLNGPWEHFGSVLQGPSKIHLRGSKDPWAPDVHFINGTFYCYYAVNNHFGKKSAIGLATTTDITKNGSWVDRGEIFGTGNQTDKIPYNETNAIDPNLFIDPKTGKPWLSFGSFYSDIWQLPLTTNLSAVAKKPEPVHLSQDGILEEGAYMSYKDGWYYLWFDKGRCCFYASNKPRPGREYSIRLGRSKSVNGPFVDRYGIELRKGGGHTVYGSHQNIYGPGGQGVIEYQGHDVLYYHYFNTNHGLNDSQALLGWNYIDYVNGWPVLINGTVSPNLPPGAITKSASTTTMVPHVSMLTSTVFAILIAFWV